MNPFFALWMAFSLIAGWAAAGFPAQAFAAPEKGIGFRAEIGFGGVAKDNAWTRLRFTVTNGTDASLKGELRFTMVQPNGGYNQQYTSEAELPPGTPVVIEMSVPGIPFTKDNNRVEFVDTQGSGKAVPITDGKPYLEMISLRSDTLIGVVARDPDTMNFMPLLNGQGYRLNVVPIADDQMPDKALQLEGLDFLVLNDTATGNWSKERIAAVRGWVQQGGTLVVAGGAGYGKTAEAFADLVPVVAGGTAELKSTDKLVQWGDKKPFAEKAPVTVSTGKLQAGTVLLADGGQILAAERNYGGGRVVYAAFDPSLQPFADWPGSPALWSRILSSSLLKQQLGVRGGAPFGNSNFWELDNAINQFPSIKQPSFGTLFTFFVVYIFVVAPVLFLVLRAFDRREWAWWIIPIVSIVSSVVIFNVGASGKNQTLAHSLRMVELSGGGDAVRSAMSGVFVPKGGSVKATFEPGVTVMPFPDNHGGTGNVKMNETFQAAKWSAEGAEAEWYEVPYWSVRKAWTQYESAAGFGKYTVAVQSIAQGSAELEIRNDTEADLESVRVLGGGKAYTVGNLKKGEAARVTVPLTLMNNQNAGWYDYGGLVFSHASGPNDPYARERGLLNSYMNGNNSNKFVTKPVIVGFSKDEESWFTVDGKHAKSDNLTLWVQPFDLGELSGDGDILPGTIQPFITKQDMPSVAYEYPSNRMNLSRGSMEFEYQLPVMAAHESDAAYDKLTIYPSEIVSGSLLELSIWNAKTGKWEVLNGSTLEVSPAEGAASYVTEEHAVRMKLEAKSEVGYALPAIGLERKGGGS
ncbi:hypothetical protein GE107_18570 [Cohnella sp. CFH 77786]|uniref:DUF7408 domain-containing protein n=1 Tax=Cohnella sp. CFH 77786 TaxID=2662265 RepID=UPI001C60C215|nr:hypothetical protein [Cohnella sp. CFH 77786]MBW5448065.1 hypothetical protein [Cohnella sp. CFH 77786]